MVAQHDRKMYAEGPHVRLQDLRVPSAAAVETYVDWEEHVSISGACGACGARHNCGEVARVGPVIRVERPRNQN